MAKIKSICIIYKGIKFRRYPNSEKKELRVYYTPNGSYIKKGIRRLHQEIWKDKYGEIPKGYDIHHKDENPENNNINNLECIKSSEHKSNHKKKYYIENKEKIIKHLNDIRDKSKEWHNTEKGKVFHIKHAKDIGFGKEKYKKKCLICDREYITNKKNGKFCSRKCCSKERRMSGKDDEIRKCKKCGEEFKVNKYSKRKYCKKLLALSR